MARTGDVEPGRTPAGDPEPLWRQLSEPCTKANLVARLRELAATWATPPSDGALHRLYAVQRLASVVNPDSGVRLRAGRTICDVILADCVRLRTKLDGHEPLPAADGTRADFRLHADHLEGASRGTGADVPDTPLASPSGSVRLYGPDAPPVVNGKQKRVLTEAEYATVKALLEVAGGKLTKDKLDAAAGDRTDARKYLYRLTEEDDDWKEAIPLPGTTGRGYRIP